VHLGRDDRKMRFERPGGGKRRKTSSSSEEREEKDGEERIGDVVHLEAIKKERV